METVETVSHDVDGRSTALAIIRSLNSLERAASAVFDGIDARIAECDSRLAALSIRARASRERTELVRKRGKEGRATKVVDLGKFPAPPDGTLYAYPAVFTGASGVWEGGSQVDAPAVTGSALGGTDIASPVSWKEQCEISDRLFRDGAPIQNPGSNPSRSRRSQKLVGLEVLPRPGMGPMPSNAQSISELLLFNSSECAYDVDDVDGEESNVLDLDGDHLSMSSSVTANDDASENRLDAAPASMVQGHGLPEIGPYDVRFKPKMKDMAKLDLPSSLNLPDIADVSFFGSDGMKTVESSIAPSVHHTELPDLPSVLDFEPVVPENPAGKRSDGSSLLHTTPDLLPERPAPIVPIVQQQKSQQETEQPQSVSSESKHTGVIGKVNTEHGHVRKSTALALQVPPQRDHIEDAESKVDNHAKLPSPMMGLLASIRDKGNLEKLKMRTEERRRKQANEEQRQVTRQQEDQGLDETGASSSDRPLSLAEEMRLKLTRRQKVLSGQQDEEEQAQERARKAALNGTLLAVGAAVKLKSTLTNAHKLEKNSEPKTGLLSLENIGSIRDILKAKEGGESQESESDSEMSWDD